MSPSHSATAHPVFSYFWQTPPHTTSHILWRDILWETYQNAEHFDAVAYPGCREAYKNVYRLGLLLTTREPNAKSIQTKY